MFSSAVLATAIGLFAATGAQAGLLDCTFIEYFGPKCGKLKMDCPKSDGELQTTSIDMNQCMGSDNWVAQKQENGGVMGACFLHPFINRGADMAFGCPDDALGTQTWLASELDTFIGYGVNGVLTCWSQTGVEASPDKEGCW